MGRMNRDWPEDREEYNRLDTDLAQKDPADRDSNDDNDIERRDSITGIIDSVTPSRKVERNEVVYGDTDMNPNADDQRDEHEADAGDIV